VRKEKRSGTDLSALEHRFVWDAGLRLTGFAFIVGRLNDARISRAGLRGPPGASGGKFTVRHFYEYYTF
jgi:hypothetical protein